MGVRRFTDNRQWCRSPTATRLLALLLHACPRSRCATPCGSVRHASWPTRAGACPRTHVKHQPLVPRRSLLLVPQVPERDAAAEVGALLRQPTEILERDGVPLGSRRIAALLKRAPVAAGPRAAEARAKLVFGEVAGHHGDLEAAVRELGRNRQAVDWGQRGTVPSSRASRRRGRRKGAHVPPAPRMRASYIVVGRGGGRERCTERWSGQRVS